MPRHYQPFVSQIAPTLALLPRLSQLAEPGSKALAQNYTRADSFAAPMGVIAAAVVVSLAGLMPTAAPAAVAARYARTPSFISQEQPTLAMLPRIVAGVAEPAPNAQPQKYTLSNIAGPEKSLAFVAAPSAVSWTATLGAPAQPQRYAQIDVARQVQPTLAMLPRIVAGVAEPGPGCQPLKYDRGSYAAPDKFNISVPAVVFEPAWFTTDGKAEIALSYARGELSAPPIAPIVSPFTSSSWRQPDPLPMVQPRFIPADVFTMPAKALPPALVTLSHWTPTIGQNAQPLDYDRGSFIAPDKSASTAPAILFVASWAQREPLPTVPSRFTQAPSFMAPEKALAAAGATPSIAAWISTMGAPAIKSRTWPTETFSSPAKAIPAVVAPSWTSAWSPNPVRPIINRFWQPEGFNKPVFISQLPGPFVACEKSFAVVQSLAASQASVISGLAAKAGATIHSLAASRGTTISGLAAKGSATISSLGITRFEIICTD